MTPGQRAIYCRIGAAIARSRHHPRELTSEARRTFLQRFGVQVRASFPDLPDAEVERGATELKRAHMLALSARSSLSRAQKKGLTATNGETLEDRRDAGATPRRPAA